MSSQTRLPARRSGDRTEVSGAVRHLLARMVDKEEFEKGAQALPSPLERQAFQYYYHWHGGPMIRPARYVVVCSCILLSSLSLAQEPAAEKVRMQWTRLGADAQIDNDFFSHVFHLRKNAGTFSKLELRINGIFMLDLIIVQYEDGKSWSPKIPLSEIIPHCSSGQ
jgi:hypothetical protein